MDEKNRELLAKTAIHIHCFSLALLARIAEKNRKEDCVMLLKNLEIADEITSYIQPYMNKDESFILKIITTAVDKELSMVQFIIENILTGEEDER